MSGALLAGRLVVRQAGAFITGVAVSRDSSRAAFATGNGIVHVADLRAAAGAWAAIAAHGGSILSLAADVGARDFLTGGDDNRLCRILGDVAGGSGVAQAEATQARVHELACGRRWVEQVASARDGAAGWIASVHGKQVELRRETGALVRGFDHPSTVSGLAFDAKGKRLAVSHYGGVSLRFTNASNDTPRRFEWKGSHIAIALHPGSEAVVTAMQENELHGWRLADGHHMRMSGYPQKTRSLAFSRNGRWLATSGADVVVLWPFFGGGPTGKAPTELAGRPGFTCTRVAFHPQHDIVAAGYADGVVSLADVGSGRILPVCAAGGSAVSALGFSPDGAILVFGTESGRMAVIDLTPSQE